MKRSYAILLLALAPICCFASRANTPASDDHDLLRVREAVWRAWFAGDEQTLLRLVPSDTIVFSSGDENWKSQSDVLREAQDFHAHGGRLIGLHFPRTAIQRFGSAAFVYSDYELEFSENGKRVSVRGRATEVFAWRDGKWVNPGWHTDSR